MTLVSVKVCFERDFGTKVTGEKTPLWDKYCDVCSLIGRRCLCMSVCMYERACARVCGCLCVCLHMCNRLV